MLFAMNTDDVLSLGKKRKKTAEWAFKTRNTICLRSVIILVITVKAWSHQKSAKQNSSMRLTKIALEAW